MLFCPVDLSPCGICRGFFKELMDLRKGDCAFADGLILVAQQHKSGAGIVFAQYHQLGRRIVLDLVDHHIFGAQVPLTGEQHFEVEPFNVG